MFTKHPIVCAALLLSATCANASGLGLGAAGNVAGNLSTNGLSSSLGATGSLASSLNAGALALPSAPLVAWPVT